MPAPAAASAAGASPVQAAAATEPALAAAEPGRAGASRRAVPRRWQWGRAAGRLQRLPGPEGPGHVYVMKKVMNFTVLHDTVGNGTVVRNRTGQLKQHSLDNLIITHYYIQVCHFTHFKTINTSLLQQSGCSITYFTFIILFYYLCHYIINTYIIIYYYS
jgi:hypothetical protein